MSAVARGTIEKNGRKQIACRFDEQTFEEINRIAAAADTPFAVMVRILVRDAIERRRRRKIA